MPDPSIVPVSDDDDGITPGTWVKVIGQVVDKPRHPDDTVVEFFSHNEQWAGHVLSDRIAVTEPPSWAYPCSSLFEFKPGRYAKCARTHAHPGGHEGGGRQWADSLTAGYFEEA